MTIKFFITFLDLLTLGFIYLQTSIILKEIHGGWSINTVIKINSNLLKEKIGYKSNYRK